MAINPETEFPGKIAPSSPQFPYGEAQNITVPGDGTGTPWVASLLNDIFGFQQAMLSESAIVPSGTPDNATASQYLDALKVIFLAASTAGKGVITGLTTFNDPGDLDHDITFRPGATHSNVLGDIIELLSNLTKQLDAPWVVGDNQGGLGSGVVAPNETYHVYSIKRQSDDLVDGYFSLSTTAADIPAGWNAYQRIGSIMTDGASNVVQYIQNPNNPDVFLLKNADDGDVNIPPTMPVVAVLRDIRVPKGFNFSATIVFNVFIAPLPAPSNIKARFFSPLVDDTDLTGTSTADISLTASDSVGTPGERGAEICKSLITNTNAQIFTKVVGVTEIDPPVGTNLFWSVQGWSDYRGRI